MRIILTFETTHSVLAAEKVLKSAPEKFRFRPTPTPAGLSDSVCGMSLELLDLDKKQDVVDYLSTCQLQPQGVFELED